MKRHSISSNDGQADVIDTKLRSAIACHQQNQFFEASQLYQQVLKLDPDHFDALQYLAAILIQSGNFQEAEALFGRAIRVNPDMPVLHSNYGSVLHELGRYGQAVASYEQALALNPAYAEAFYNLGNSLCALDRFEDAIINYKKAIVLNPASVEVRYNLGNALQKLNRFKDAIAYYDEALAIAPRYALAHLNRGNALRELRLYDEALTSYDRAINHKSDFAEAFSNRGGILKDLKRFDEAFSNYFKALSINPNDPEVYWNTGLMLLLLGNFKDGLEFYEWRKKIKEPLGHRHFPRPLWLGQEDLKGKRILIHEEQGVGDIIQFCRYIRRLEAQGADVVFAVTQRLHGLMSSLGGSMEIRSPEDITLDFDFHCPLLSLPRAFNTDLTSIPSHTPYLFAAPAKTQALRRQMMQNGAKKICGVSWFSKNAVVGAARNVDLLELFKTIDTRDYIFVNLQYGDVSQEIADLKAQQGVEILSLSSIDNFNDLDGFAALVDACDLIVTIDNTTAHIAGALNKKTYLMLPYVPDWRWMLDRQDSPWYPQMRLLRQSIDGDWGSVFLALKGALREMEKTQ